MKYRSRIEIIAQMLNAAQGGTVKTRIMSGAYVSYTQLTDYLGRLMDKGLLTKNGDIYTTTPLGMEFLRMYGSIQDLMPELEQREAIVALA